MQELQNPELIFNLLFKGPEGKPLKLYNYQKPIFETILRRYPKRNYCRATTQAGKSFALGYGIAALAGLTPYKKIGIIAPTGLQARIIMGYVVDAFLSSELLSQQLPLLTHNP